MMIRLSIRTRLTLIAVLVFGLGLVVVFEFTDWCHLEAVTLNDEPVENWESRFGLSAEKSMLDQPVSDLARQLLEKPNIVKVDVEYSLPGTMHIKTNHFTPSCYALDKASGRLWGLNHQGRVIPLPAEQPDWEHPVLTGLDAGRLFALCDDVRVRLIVPQLEELADDNLELYRLIDGIDFTSPDFMTVTISGLPYRLKTDADGFYEQVTGFIRFIENYQPEVADAEVLDLRYDDMIVQAGQGR